jgi:ATP-dependent Clp protease ATP-binding subunit ClpA
LDAVALAAVGIDLEAVRARVEARFGEGALDRPRGRRCRRGGDARGAVPFSARAKKTLELALREAAALGDRRIGGEHLALALARDDVGGAAGRVLDEAGIDRDAVAAVVARRRAA